MRPRRQQGQICKRGTNWMLRFHEDRIVNGAVKRVRTMRVLAAYSDYPLKVNQTNINEVRSKLQQQIVAILAGVNEQSSCENTLTLAEFIVRRYFTRLDQRLLIPAGNALHIEPSTIDSYRDIWKVHVEKHPVASIQIRNFTAKDGQQFLESLPQQLSHKTHLRIKNFLRGVFTYAITNGDLTINPMEHTKVGGQTIKSGTVGMTVRQKKIRASNEHAYTLEEVADMLDKVPEPARTVIALAAFTGLSRSELRGLKWADYDGDSINVQRKIWMQHIGAPKTNARLASVPVVPVLKTILRKYKTNFPAGEDDWIFRGEKLMRPLDLDNLSRRDIPQYINGAWFGWHAFRRGLGTRLNEAGVTDKTIQSILRHANVSTTQAYYILPDHKRAEAGLKKFAKTLKTKYGITG
jgi:integrase